MNTEQVHKAIDETFATWQNHIVGVLLDQAYDGGEINEAIIFAEVAKLSFLPHPCDKGATVSEVGELKVLTTENKKRLIDMAEVIGPDYAQALYRAIVFITKVV